MANAANFTAVLDEVAGMENFLVDSPRAKELLTNLKKLQSAEPLQLEWFFSMLRRKLSSVCTIAAVCRLGQTKLIICFTDPADQYSQLLEK